MVFKIMYLGERMVKILIVDDEESICNTLTWVLDKDGYDVTSVKDFQDAEEVINKETFDIYIIDIFLPGKNGLDLIKLIKQLKKPGVIIVITGYPNVPALIDSVRLDAYDFIKKPFKISYLKKVIDHILTLQDGIFGYEIQDEYVNTEIEKR